MGRLPTTQPTHTTPQGTTEEELEKWVSNILHTKLQHDRPIDPDTPVQYVDSKMLHLWDAYGSLERRWKRHKHRHRLRRRLSLLRQEITKHATYLAKASWIQLCDDIKGQLSMRRTWSFLRHLLDPTKSRTHQHTRITQLLHSLNLSQEAILHYLQTTYIPKPSSSDSTPLFYTGTPNSELDAEITREEVEAALRALRRKTTPGPDKISNKILRHLDDTSIDHLTELFNTHWNAGTLPRSWKHSDITLIPKPAKPLALPNLRPISLTSCLGKLLEHVIHNRLSAYLEEHSLFPPNLIGFRPGLSTQDALLQIHHDIIQHPPARDYAAILALDLHKAFDHVGHSAILSNINTLHLGARTYTYIRNFLSDRTATLRLGTIKSNTFDMPNRGTPQGAVLSPLLFNLAMLPLANALETIPSLHSTIYADDITLWVTQGSDAHIEATLSAGAATVSRIAAQAGLTSSAAKSELLLLPPLRVRPTPPTSIQIILDGQAVPRVSQLRLLGMHLQANRSSTHTIHLLRTHTIQTIGLIKRISSRRHGLTELERLRLVQCFLVSRFCYHLPYTQLTSSQRTSLDALLRRAYRSVLLLPPHAPTQRLLALGIHNTVDEIIEAHRLAQLTRLSQTPTGRHILERIHANPPRH